MLKKILPALILPLLLAGCSTQFTNLTPQQQVRNPNNLYKVEVAFNSTEQAMRWGTIKPQIVVGTEFYQMQPTPLMSNRWKGFVPAPADASAVRYRYKFDYLKSDFGTAKPDSVLSPEYKLRIVGQ